MMRIGIDLDNTIFFCNSLVYKFVTALQSRTSSSPLSYKEVGSKAPRDVHPFLKKAFKFLNPAEYRPFPFAVDVINKLHERGAEIYFISSRPHVQPMIALTTAWLQANQVKYDNLILGCKNKGAFAYTHRIDFMIDDHAKVCSEARKKGVIAIQFRGNQKTYALSCPPEFVTLSSWKDIERFIWRNWEGGDLQSTDHEKSFLGAMTEKPFESELEK